MDNIQLLREALDIIRDGYLAQGPRRCILKLSPEERREAIYLSPRRVAELKTETPEKVKYHSSERGGFDAVNQDSFTAAQELAKSVQYRSDLSWYRSGTLSADPNRVLVLNFANPDRPGGSVRQGGQGQEKGLCRKSTLLASLESEAAAPFYAAHQAGASPLASDAILLSPNVEVFRDENNELLEEPFTVAVLSCAAPRANTGAGPSGEELEKLLYDRIAGMLHVAAAYRYHYLVLGAWGCGAFGNDPGQIAQLFRRAFKELRRGDYRYHNYFRGVAFAVPDHSASQHKFNCFDQMCRHFYDEEIAEEKRRREESEKMALLMLEKQRQAREPYRDKIRGCLLGGAVGDALGYPVEFLSWKNIQSRFGPGGIQSYDWDMETGLALISDDTQMTLFTANGILFRETRGKLRGIASSPSSYVAELYRDWLLTQTGKPRGADNFSWLLDVPELWHRRAPGGTCLSALSSGEQGSVKHPINDSKGCGGVMRVAPMGLRYGLNMGWSREKLAREGAEIAAITHGHSLGYIPAAVLTHMVHVAVYGNCSRGDTLLDAVEDAMDMAASLFGQDPHWPELRTLVDRAEELAGNEAADADNIHALGGGWVAEETLAIAIYCALRYSGDFSRGVIAAVNHSGDSDSTGAVTGNILGAWLGCGAIEDKWKQNLELRNIILEMADDLCYGCPLEAYHEDRDPRWLAKYVEGRYTVQHK